MQKFTIIATLLCAACSSTTGGALKSGDGGANPSGNGVDAGSGHAVHNEAGAAPGECVTLPTDAQIDVNATPCTPVAGTWTIYELSVDTNSYFIGCSVADAQVPVTQADFDTDAQSESPTFGTITSNEDYVRKASCASGSFQTTTASASTIEYIWTK